MCCSQLDKNLEADKKLKRAERFGVYDPSLEELKKKARMERFGVVDEKMKLQMRSERFKPLATSKGSGSAPMDADSEARMKVRCLRTT